MILHRYSRCGYSIVPVSWERSGRFFINRIDSRLSVPACKPNIYQRLIRAVLISSFDRFLLLDSARFGMRRGKDIFFSDKLLTPKSLQNLSILIISPNLTRWALLKKSRFWCKIALIAMQVVQATITSIGACMWAGRHEFDQLFISAIGAKCKSSALRFDPKSSSSVCSMHF